MVVETKDDKVIVKSQVNNYISEVKGLKNTKPCTSEYLITENGIEFKVAVDIEHDVVTINDTLTYTVEQYLEACRIQAKYLERANIKCFEENSVDNNDFSLLNILSKFPVQRCSTCGKYSGGIPPTSGYETKTYLVSKAVNLELEYFVTTAYFTIAAKLVAPYLEPIKGIEVVKAIFKKVEEHKIVSTGVGLLIGMQINLYYNRYQGYHKVCPKAVREIREYYYDKACTKYVYTTEGYFYNSKHNEINSLSVLSRDRNCELYTKMVLYF